MRFDIFTLFPEMFVGVFDSSILQRARQAGLIEIATHDIRAATSDKHHVTDDTAYGGGGGMVMKVEPIVTAVENVLTANHDAHVVLLSPQGRLFTQEVAWELTEHSQLALICGHYEGTDERVRETLKADEISIGDYVLTGGEIPAMLIVDAVARLIPGVLGQASAPRTDSHANGLLEHPHYTRPLEFRGQHVPEILLSGHHAQINEWRRHESLRRTFERRPDLLAHATLSDEDKNFLRKLGWTGD